MTGACSLFPPLSCTQQAQPCTQSMMLQAGRRVRCLPGCSCHSYRDNNLRQTTAWAGGTRCTRPSCLRQRRMEQHALQTGGSWPAPARCRHVSTPCTATGPLTVFGLADLPKQCTQCSHPHIPLTVTPLAVLVAASSALPVHQPKSVAALQAIAREVFTVGTTGRGAESAVHACLDLRQEVAGAPPAIAKGPAPARGRSARGVRAGGCISSSSSQVAVCHKLTVGVWYALHLASCSA